MVGTSNKSVPEMPGDLIKAAINPAIIRSRWKKPHPPGSPGRPADLLILALVKVLQYGPEIRRRFTWATGATGATKLVLLIQAME